jgi:predicted RNA methylase
MLISQHLPRIVELVRDHATVSVEAATGSGKSVGIPAAIAATKSRCFVTVPTRTAAISLAEYQRVLQQELNPITDVNKLVGFAAEGDVQYTAETIIAYVTGGHARRKMLSCFNNGAVQPTGIDFCDVLMVDEVHSGSLDNTVIISLWIAARNAGVRIPRLIIASATPIPLDINPKPYVYKVEVPSLPITDQYMMQDYDIEDPIGPLYNGAAQLALQIHRDTPIDSGHILIFAPGSAEVETITAALTESLKVPIPGKTAIIVPAFSALKREDIALIYKTTSPTERKIVIATNIAEMSITISDIGHVIDTMAERRAETSKNGGFRLATHYISKDSAQQRRGRTGRTRPGVCYRMCTQDTYNRLEQHRPPEIERVPIYDVVIELLDVGLVPENTLIGVDPKRVIDAVTILQDLRMIAMVDGRRRVSESGHFAPNFPLSVRNAAFLWKWINYNGLHFNQKIIEEANIQQGLDFNFFEIDPSSEYSTLRPSQMPSVTAIYQHLNLNPTSIIDATANVGGDTVHFARLFPAAEITSIEINPTVASILRRNIENIPTIIRQPRAANIHAVNMSAIDYFKTNRYADMIFFDPPWGGRDYMEQASMNLFLDDTPIGVLIGDILSQGMTPLVSLKLPVNADINQILANINDRIAITPQLFNVNDLDGKTSYLLMFIQPTTPVQLLPASVMMENRPSEVSLVSASRPIFPGIVLAAIIDSYGPSYFWIPRKKPGQTPEEYNLAVQSYKDKHFTKYRGYSDLETALKMWDDLLGTIGDIRGHQRKIVQWAQANSINNKKIRELLKVIEQSVNAASRLGYRIQIGRFTPVNAVNAARPLLLSVYSDMTCIHSRDITYYNPRLKVSYRLDTRETVNELASNPPLGVIGLVTAEIKTKTGVLHRIGFALDTDKDGLGRPIKRREISETRGPRVITHGRSQPSPVKPPAAGLTNITETLQMLASLGLNKPGPLVLPGGGDIDPILGPWIRNEDNASVSYMTISQYSPAMITQAFLKHRVEFPLRRRYRSLAEAQTAFATLFQYQPNWQTTPYVYADAKSLKVPLRMTFQSAGTEFNQYLWLPNDETTYQTIDWVPDYFIESSRMQCTRKGAAIKMSPHDAWYSYGTYVETAIGRVMTQRQDLSLANVREALYLDKRVPECTHEKVTFLSSLLKLLNIETPRIFDGSAGWGDRMIAAMTVGAAYYLGVDPNMNSQPGFQQMVDVFGSMILPNEPREVIHRRFGVLPLSMPDAVLPADAIEGSFDITFLSPPSFDSEMYSKDIGQSVQRWTDQRSWYFNFLFATLDRCWSMVRPGGFFVLQSILVENIAPYVEFKFRDAFFCGPIGVEVSNRKKPLWIWCKIDPANLTPTQQQESANLKQLSTAYITGVFPELIGGAPPTPVATPAQIIVPPTIPPPVVGVPAAGDLNTAAALDLLAELDFGEPTATVPVVLPITGDMNTAALDLLAELDFGDTTGATPIMPVVTTPTVPVAPRSPAVIMPTADLNTQAAMDLLRELNFD